MVSLAFQRFDYHPFGMLMDDTTNWRQDTSYRFGFNGQEMDNSIHGEGNSINFGARILDTRLGRWMSTDPLQHEYPSFGAYVFATNMPIEAIDPDGNIVIYVNGLMLGQALRSFNGRPPTIDNPFREFVYKHVPTPYPTFEMTDVQEPRNGGPQYLGEQFDYWFDIDDGFAKRWKDYRSIYVSGSNSTVSSGKDRYNAGLQSGIELVEKIMSGEIELDTDETIKLVGHSQGGAHAAGMAYVLNSAYELGMIQNRVEMVVYLAPHQPLEFEHPENIFGLQYSRSSDKVSSVGIAKYSLISGGSEFGAIKGVTEFKRLQDLEGGLATGNKGGHDCDTYGEALTLPKDEYGGIPSSAPTESRQQIGPRLEDGTF